MLKGLIVLSGSRILMVFVLLMVPLMMLFAQEVNEKFSVSTRMLLNELKTKVEKLATTLRCSLFFKLRDKTKTMKTHRLIVIPDTMGNISYVLPKNPISLSDLRAQGVTSKFDGTGVVLGIFNHGFNFLHIAFLVK